MPKHSKSKRARQAQRQAHQQAAQPAAPPPNAPATAPQAGTTTTAAAAAPAPRFVNPPATPARPAPSAPVRPSARTQRPDIKVGPELRRIGIVTGIIVLILVVLAIVFRG